LITSHDEYRRNPFGHKIKGVDYEFLNQALNESLGIRTKRYYNNAYGGAKSGSLHERYHEYL
jgi:predicted RNA methylase